METVISPVNENPSTVKIIKVVYILNLIALVFPLCSLIGVVFAYVFHQDGKDYLKSHFQYIIRGFWISLLYFAISGLLCLILVGFVLIALTIIWWIIRNAKGLKNVLEGKPIVNPTSWMF